MKPAELASYIRTIPDFPRAGIAFKDITPLLAEPDAFRELTLRIADAVRQSGAECVVGLEARGFIIGMAVAYELALPFVPARKPGKLPAAVVEANYDLEYGSATLQIHADAITPGKKAAIVDDLLATGGTAEAAARLVAQLGATVSGYFFAIELTTLGGRDRLGSHTVHSVLPF